MDLPPIKDGARISIGEAIRELGVSGFNRPQAVAFLDESDNETRRKFGDEIRKFNKDKAK